MIQHKKIYNTISKKYNLIFWQDVYSPKNYTSFRLSEQDYTNNTPAFMIEFIPAWKYLKTLYIIKIKDNEIINKIINDIEEEYKKATYKKPVEWCMDFNFEKAWFLF